MAQTKKDPTKIQLANALDINPDEIMDYRKTTDGSYNVVLFSFQKFIGVIPQETSKVPDNLRAAYQRPENSTKIELGVLASELELDVIGEDGKKPTKQDYVKAINNYRVNN